MQTAWPVDGRCLDSVHNNFGDRHGPHAADMLGRPRQVSIESCDANVREVSVLLEHCIADNKETAGL